MKVTGEEALQDPDCTGLQGLPARACRFGTGMKATNSRTFCRFGELGPGVLEIRQML